MEQKENTTPNIFGSENMTDRERSLIMNSRLNDRMAFASQLNPDLITPAAEFGLDVALDPKWKDDKPTEDDKSNKNCVRSWVQQSLRRLLEYLQDVPPRRPNAMHLASFDLFKTACLMFHLEKKTRDSNKLLIVRMEHNQHQPEYRATKFGSVAELFFWMGYNMFKFIVSLVNTDFRARSRAEIVQLKKIVTWLRVYNLAGHKQRVMAWSRVVKETEELRRKLRMPRTAQNDDQEAKIDNRNNNNDADDAAKMKGCLKILDDIIICMCTYNDSTRGTYFSYEDRAQYARAVIECSGVRNASVEDMFKYD